MQSSAYPLILSHAPTHVSLPSICIRWHQVPCRAVRGAQRDEVLRISQRSFGQSAVPILGRRSPSYPPSPLPAQHVLFFLGRHSQMFAPGRGQGSKLSQILVSTLLIGYSVAACRRLESLKIGCHHPQSRLGPLGSSSLPACQQDELHKSLFWVCDGHNVQAARLQCGSCLPEL